RRRSACSTGSRARRSPRRRSGPLRLVEATKLAASSTGPLQVGSVIAMNGADMLRYVDQMHRDKSIPKDVIFGGIEAALQQATERLMGEEEEAQVSVSVDRGTGVITAKKGE